MATIIIFDPSKCTPFSSVNHYFDGVVLTPGKNSLSDENLSILRRHPDYPRYKASGAIAPDAPEPLPPIVVAPGGGSGGASNSGDMLKSVYDLNNDGIVDFAAANAKPTVKTIPFSTNITFDASSINPRGGTVKIVLLGNSALTIANPTDGQSIEFEFTQDATGGRLVTLSNLFAFGSDAPQSAFVLSTSANASDLFRCKYSQIKNKWLASSLIRGF